LLVACVILIFFEECDLYLVLVVQHPIAG
jgi:hypothetical protein